MKKPKPTKKEYAQLAKSIERLKAKIGQSRDELRDLLDDANAVLESVDRAEEALQTAVDAISEYV